MIDLESFQRLRMSQFLNQSEIMCVADFEFQRHINVGDSFGFSEWLRTTNAPNELWSLSLEIDDFPRTTEVLTAIDLPLTPGMVIDDLIRVLGPYDENWSFVDDRRSYAFLVPRANPVYRVECTVMDVGGLSYVVVMVLSVFEFPASEEECNGHHT